MTAPSLPALCVLVSDDSLDSLIAVYSRSLRRLYNVQRFLNFGRGEMPTFQVDT